MVLRSISHLSEYRTFHETFLLLVGDQSFSSNEPMGLYATPILQYNKNTRKAYPIISVALRGRKSRLIGIFFRCSSRKKINKYNQFWSKLLKKNASVLFNPFLLIRILPSYSMYFCLGLVCCG